MQLIANGTQGPTTVPTKQTPSGTPGYANSGTPGTYTPTVFDPDMGNTLIAEIANAVTGAGLTLSASNNAQLLAAIPIIATGRLLNIQIFGTAGTYTYTPTAGTKSVEVEVIGGGGGGGGSANTGASQASAGAGGAAGGYDRARIVSGFSGATITVGAAGIAGDPSGGGSPGGTSSFGSFVTATGGAVGSLGPALSAALLAPYGSSLGGVGTGGYASSRGGCGQYAFYAGTNSTSGAGGPSILGAGAPAVFGASNGTAATTPGSGGGGGVQGTPSSTGATGGNGTQGLVIVKEFS